MNSKGCLSSRFFFPVMLSMSLCTTVWCSISPHPAAPAAQTVCQIDVELEVGQYIHIWDQSPIKVQQYGMDNPYRTYRGCKVLDVHANFDAVLYVSAVGIGVGSGQWRAEIGPEQYVGGWKDFHMVSQGANVLKICVQGNDVDISKFHPQPGMKIAEVHVSVMPL